MKMLFFSSRKQFCFVNKMAQNMIANTERAQRVQ